MSRRRPCWRWIIFYNLYLLYSIAFYHPHYNCVDHVTIQAGSKYYLSLSPQKKDPMGETGRGVSSLSSQHCACDLLRFTHLVGDQKTSWFGSFGRYDHRRRWPDFSWKTAGFDATKSAGNVHTLLKYPPGVLTNIHWCDSICGLPFGNRYRLLTTRSVASCRATSCL